MRKNCQAASHFGKLKLGWELGTDLISSLPAEQLREEIHFKACSQDLRVDLNL